MKKCKTCREELVGLSPKALAQMKYCPACRAERRKLRQKEYIKRTKYNHTYAQKYYNWKREWKREIHPSVNEKRLCLSCEKKFPSIGPGNRICLKCKTLEAYDYDMVPKRVFDYL